VRQATPDADTSLMRRVSEGASTWAYSEDGKSGDIHSWLLVLFVRCSTDHSAGILIMGAEEVRFRAGEASVCPKDWGSRLAF